MAIGTNDAIWKFGTQDKVDSTSGTVANDAYSVAGDITSWTNDDDAPYASFVWRGSFGTAASAGNIELFAHLPNIEGTNEAPIPQDEYRSVYLGTFAIDYTDSATAFSSTIENVLLPVFETSQVYDFYIKNNGTSQTINSSWTLHVTPLAIGPA